MDSTLEGLWENACSLLAETLSKDVYERWIAVIEPVSFSDDLLTLAVANDFYHDWLEENYIPLISKAVTSHLGAAIEIKLIVDKTQPSRRKDPEAAATAEPVVPRKKNSSASADAKDLEKRLQSSGLNPKYTFESFIVGPSNNFAHAASLAVAHSPGKAYNPLFIYGGVGLGKTHLMQAIGNHAIRHSKAQVRYISSEAFVNDYIDALQRKSLVQFRKKYRNTDLLLIDDIQFLSGKDRMQEEFFHTFNTLFDSHKQIILTSDRPAAEIPDLEHRLVSRFEWGLVTELETPDVETRIAILRNKEEQLNIALNEDVVNFIAENIRSNIRRLEGALIRAASYASLTGKDLNQDALENLLRDTLDQERIKTTFTLEDIQRQVAEYYDIRFSDIIGKKRPDSIAKPRQVAMYLCRCLTQHSLPTIGEAFGKNHATVLHACRVLEKRIDEDVEIRQTINLLKQKISGRA